MLLKGKNGEILVKKSPAATIDTILNALSKIVKIKPIIKVIGSRHGEKFHETLLTKEELNEATEYKDYLKLVQIIEI